MVSCLRITSRIALLSAGALALCRVPHLPPFDRLHHPLGTLQAAGRGGSPHSTRWVALMAAGSPCVLQQPLRYLALNPFYSKRPLLCLLHRRPMIFKPPHPHFVLTLLNTEKSFLESSI